MPTTNWTFLLLCVCLPSAWGLDYFPESMVVGDREKSVTLECPTDYEGKLTWRHQQGAEDQIVNESPFANYRGRNLVLHELDTPSFGNYSCWGGGKWLGSTYLLLSEEEAEEEKHTEINKEFLSCSAQTYGCSFTCSWTLRGFRAARLRYCRHGQNSTDWIHPRSSTSSLGQRTFEFSLTLSGSPFAEESVPLEISGEAISSSHLLKTSHSFYLRDIVQPDPPESVQCERTSQSLMVTVQPPSSWAQPLSYFPLAHEIQFVYRNDGTMGLSNSSEVPQGISKLRVRSRDPLVPSAWSVWSPWKKVTM